MDKKWLKNNAANLITCTRIIGTAIMIFMPTLSVGFFIAYTYAGVSDVADGFVARATKTTSDFGSRLDSFADLAFYVSMMVKILPILNVRLPRWVMVLIFAIFIGRVLFYIYVELTRHQFLHSHSIFNKATGFILFLIPYSIGTKILTPHAILNCAVAVAGFAADIRMVSKTERVQ